MRHSTLYMHGIFCFTRGTSNASLIGRGAAPVQTLNQAAQGKQILQPKQGSPLPKDDDRIRRCDARPRCRQVAEDARLIVKIDSVQPPVPAIRHQRVLPAIEWMKRVSDSERSLLSVATECI